MKLSIIIPVYNTAKYLRKCLDSVLAAAEKVRSRNYELGMMEENSIVPNSSFSLPPSIEIICVDDGSTDGSGEILEEYGEKVRSRNYELGMMDGIPSVPNSSFSLPTFIVIHQANAGVSAARNAALDVATGEWVVFVDSDDWISEDYLAKAFAYIAADPTLDLVATCVEIVKDGKEYINVRAGLEKKLFEGDLLALTHRNEYMALRSSFCDLVIRGDLIRRHNVRFPGSMKSGEDSLFAETLFAYARKMIFDPEIKSYYYRKDSGQVSLSRSVSVQDAKASLARVLANIGLFSELGSYGSRLNACHCAVCAIAAVHDLPGADKDDYIRWLSENENFKRKVLPFLVRNGISLKSRLFALFLAISSAVLRRKLIKVFFAR